MIWIVKNWKPLAIAAIVGFLYIRGSIIKSERDEALHAIEAMQEAAFKREVEVTLLTERGKRAVEALTQSHDEQIAQLLEAKANDKKTIANYRNQLANSLRDKAKDYHDRLPVNDADKIASTDSNAAATGEESLEFYRGAYIGCQTYVETLEKAGMVCATDYNACKSYVDQEQKRIGVYLD